MPTLDGHHHLQTPHTTVAAAQASQVDGALASLPSLLRPLAARALRSSTFYCEDYRIVVSDTAFSVQCDARATLTRTWSGTDVPLVVEGKTLQSRVIREGGEVQLTLVGENGSRTTRYSPRPSGIHVAVTVESGHLDAPIRWAMEYGTVP